MSPESEYDLPGAPNTSSEQANDGFKNRNKIKSNFCSQVLDFCYFLVFELRNHHVWKN